MTDRKQYIYYVEKLEDFESEDAKRLIKEHSLSLDDLRHYGMRKDMFQALKDGNLEREKEVIQRIDFEKAFLFEAIILFELAVRDGGFAILTTYIPFAEKFQLGVPSDFRKAQGKAYQIFRKENTSKFYREKAIRWLTHLEKYRRKRGDALRKTMYIR
jgi:hypothetical protein